MQEVLEQLRAAVRGIWFYRWWGVWSAIAIGVAGTATVVLMPNQYEAAARVYVDTQSILKPLMTGLAVQPNLEQQVMMVSRTLVSRPNVERVARMSDLDLAATSERERAALVDQLLRDIQFQGVRGAPNLYSITYRDRSGQSAQRVVQSLLSIFVESSLGDKRRDSSQARRFIDEQIKVYEGRLVKAEEALKNFKLANLNQMPDLAQSYVARMGDAQNLVNQARLDLGQAESSRAAINQQLAGEKPTMQTSVPLAEAPVPVIGPSEIEKRLDLQRRLLAELRTRYTEAHPDVSEAVRILDQLERQLEVERRAEAVRPAPAAAATRLVEIANPVYEKLRVAKADAEALVAAARARVNAYEARLGQTRAAASTIPKVEAEFTQLNRDYEVLQKSYQELLARRESASMSGEMEASANIAEFRVVDPPRVAPKPVWPNRLLLLGLVFAASLAGGLAVAFLRDQLRPAFFDAHTLRTLASRPLLGVVSLVADAKSIARSRRERIAFSGVTVAFVAMFMSLYGFYWLQQAAK